VRDGGVDPTEAILEAVRSRVRPIFMTTLTTVFGLLPLVLFPGAGSELYRGLGAVLLGGMLFSTIIVLVLVPALLGLGFRGQRRDDGAALGGERVAAGSGPARPSRPHGVTDDVPPVTVVDDRKHALQTADVGDSVA
jgi:hypothetical protein